MNSTPTRPSSASSKPAPKCLTPVKGSTGQLPEHLLQHRLHFFQLSSQRFEIDGLSLFCLEIPAQILFGSLQLVELVLLVADEQVPTQKQDDDDDQRGKECLDRCRPSTGIIEVEIVKVEIAALIHILRIFKFLNSSFEV